MTAIGDLIQFVFGLSLIVAPLVAAAVWMFVLWRRRRQSALDGACDPLGSMASRVAETIAIAAGCFLLVLFALTQSDWRDVAFSTVADTSILRLWGAAAVTLSAIGLVAAFVFAWRGAGSVAAVVLMLVVFGYCASIIASSHTDHRPFSPPSNKRSYPDVNLTLNIGGINVPGADMRVNGVSLGKTPVRITLSEFFAKVPDWKQPPGPPIDGQNLFSSTNQQAKPIFRNKYWAQWELPDFPFVVLPEAMQQELEARRDRSFYVQFELNGELGEFAGSTTGGGNDNNSSVHFYFRFPKRQATLDRLLTRARLADYKVDKDWLQAASAFGPDAWIAVWLATPDEPEMNQVLDTWARWQYDLDDPNGFEDAWSNFERIRAAVDREGRYTTVSPAGHAVALLAPQLPPAQLAAAAEPLIATISAVSYGRGSRPDGLSFLSVQTPSAPGLQFPFGNSGTYTMSGISGVQTQLLPSGMALAHAIELVNAAVGSGAENVFQRRLVPPLLRADVERRTPYALECATYLGGPIADRFLIRQADWTHDADWSTNFLDFEFMHGVQVNRWLYWAAQLRGPAGVSFRANRRDELFDLADETTANLFGMGYSVAAQLPFLFLENDRGQDGIGRQYWRRFRSLTDAQPHSALENQLGYLTALGPAAEPEMFVDVAQRAWQRDFQQFSNCNFIEYRLPQIPMAKRAVILDGIIAALAADSIPTTTPDWQKAYALRRLRAARYLELDDEAAVQYVLEWQRGELAKDEQPDTTPESFLADLAQTATRRPRLLKAFATAPEPKFRLAAVAAIRQVPTPSYRELVHRLLLDKDDDVRKSAAEAEKYWTSLQTSCDDTQSATP